LLNVGKLKGNFVYKCDIQDILKKIFMNFKLKKISPIFVILMNLINILTTDAHKKNIVNLRSTYFLIFTNNHFEGIF